MFSKYEASKKRFDTTKFYEGFPFKNVGAMEPPRFANIKPTRGGWITPDFLKGFVCSYRTAVSSIANLRGKHLHCRYDFKQGRCRRANLSEVLLLIVFVFKPDDKKGRFDSTSFSEGFIQKVSCYRVATRGGSTHKKSRVVHVLSLVLSNRCVIQI